jgi:hypothetical protein
MLMRGRAGRSVPQKEKPEAACNDPQKAWYLLDLTALSFEAISHLATICI